jgi:phosphate-selective porin OprO/OprP
MKSRFLSVLLFLGAFAASGAAVPALRAQTVDPPAAPQSVSAPPQGPAGTDLPQGSEQPEKKSTFQWKFYWKGWDGLQFGAVKPMQAGKVVTAPSGADVFDFTRLAFTGKFGAKFAYDGAAFWNVKNLGGAEDGAEVRRARIYIAGDAVLFAPWSFRIEMGWTGNAFSLEESYIQFKNYPRIGTIQFGQFQAPMSLEAITASRDFTFLEQSSAVMALAPGVNTGFQLGRPAFHDRMTWALGLFASAPVTDTGDATKEARRAMGRMTWLVQDRTGAEVPWLVHLGVSWSHLLSGSDTVQYQSRPESHLAPYMVQTGEIKADNADTLGVEAAWVNGPISAQGEYLRTAVNHKQGQGIGFCGSYVSASWFVTGESRPYSKTEGIFTRLKPFQNFTVKHGGHGAVEVALRYSVVNLNSGAIHGGKMNSLTAGLNWYINPNAKIRVNYVTAQSDLYGPTSKANIAEMRFEFDF